MVVVTNGEIWFHLVSLFFTLSFLSFLSISISALFFFLTLLKSAAGIRGFVNFQTRLFFFSLLQSTQFNKH